ncbi:MAG TPA: metallophosphoesterase [Fervidicoccus fontis]|uniref:Metallophosphoesterase n=1 Tax=Fervidicoccus fontis TaxID=683846 RepID=A0A7C2YKT5_9CREN|nr:metallophosphoesterase [Fervidicoccus fontis]
MESKTKVFLFISTFVLLALVSIPAAVHAESTPAVIFPLFSEPEAVVPGNILNITIAGISDPTGLTLSITSGNLTYNLSYTYELIGGNLILHAQIGSISPGLYDLLITQGNQSITSMRSVVVFSQWPSVLTIAHFTDVHIGVVNSYPKTEDALDLYTNAILLAQMLGANVIIETGDIADTAAVAQQYVDFVNITQFSGLPTVILPGNHDYSGDSSLNNWHKYIGANYFYLRWGPYLIIALDSGATGTVPMDQLNWAEQVLKNNTDATVKIIGFHHPLFRTDLYGKINGTYTNVAALQQYFYSSWASDLTLAAKVLELVEKYNVSLVLSGHVHSDGAVLYNGKTWFITTTALGGPVGPVSTASYHGHADYHGFRLINVYANGTVAIVPRTDNPDVFSGPTSIPVENIFSKYVSTDKTIAWIFQANGEKELEVLTPGNFLSLSIHVPANLVPSGAKLLTFGNISSSSISCGPISCVVNVNISKSSVTTARILLTNVNDTTPPTIGASLISPKKPVAGRDSITVTFQTSDPEWGVAKVKLLVRLPNGTQMEYLMRDVGQGYYQATIPPLNVPYILIDAVAENSGGLSSDAGWTNLTMSVPTTTTPPPTVTTVPPVTTTTTTAPPVTTTTTTTTTTTITTTTTTTSTTTPPATTTTTQATSPTTTAAPGGMGTTAIIAIAVVVIVVVGIAAAFFMRK